ncbi:unnamed protein product [Trifolium pratense]|uniref:Uncharacterized protein n=2 Tax=Trifolium pratense TaxID=57577 RepID=A0ACB0K1K5_TRIPR|nr:unnamed protein product [Trifolium pratense]
MSEEENKKVKQNSDSELNKNSSGAGANAASRADMTLATTDPLSEIVWSPEKGLSLKCADKNSSLFRDVGPSCSMVLSLPQSVTYCNSITDKPIDDNFLKSIAIACVKPDYKADEENSNGKGSRGNEEKVKTVERAPNFPYDQDWEKNIGDQANIGTDEISRIEGNKLSAISVEPKLIIMEQNPSPGRPSNEGIDFGIGKKAVGIGTDDDLHVFEPIIEYKGSGAAGTNLTSSSRNPLEKTEFCAENDLRNVDTEPACAATCGVTVIETKSKSREDNEMTLVCNKFLPVLHSPCNSGIRVVKNKGKEKSLSDRDANVRLSMDSDSNSSVESCNSARFFSTGKKRRNYQQQQLIIGSKRAKNSVEETSGSKSYIKHESSFKNWISSMVNGISQSVQHDSNSLSLRIANPGPLNAWSDEKLVASKTNQVPEPKNTGFKSIFQSMYSPSLKNVGTRMFHHEGEGDEDFEPSNNTVPGINATPITCYPENNSLAERHFQSNRFVESIGRYDAGPSQPNIEPLNFFNSQEISKVNQVENEKCSNLDLSKEEMASNSSSTRQNTNNTDNVNSNAPSERKEAENIGHRRDNLGSLWISRFAPKSTAPLFNDLSSSPGITNSEQNASMFARRSVASDHSMPTNKAECTSQVNMFCLFCGTKGHQLSDCSAVAESELEDLQKNVNSYEGLENFPFMCIKCFQLNHWAISCSKLPSGNNFIPSNEGSARQQTDAADRILSGGTIHDRTDHKTDQNVNLKRKSNDIVTVEIECNASCKKYCGSSSKENKFKDKPIITSPSRHVPERIFDAVKKLQLSRTDILKWITAHGSISQLDGFFLRLRFGKWEEGPGGTGYHVACISETERHSLDRHTRKSLSVKVGGIKCMVESHYISNQDFLEDEIKEWWSNTSKAGVEIPSEEDLIANFKKKQLLGL